MLTTLRTAASILRDLLRSRLSMQMEIVALRHQLAVYQRTAKRAMIQPADRVLWALIRRMSRGNPLWGAPRIVGELGKIGIAVAKSTVEKYMVRRRKPPSPTWRAFLKNHIKEIIAIDFFVVPTVRNRILFVFLLLAHDRRRVIHFNVTANPTAAWTAQQIVEAFPWQDPPKYLLRDRDKIYGKAFKKWVIADGFEEVLTAARSTWQNPYVSIAGKCAVRIVGKDTVDVPGPG